MKPSLSARSLNGQGSCYKEVRFSPTATPIIRRAQSLPGTNPSQSLGSQSDTSTPGANYVDQARSLLDRQRTNFEHERALFAEERRLWEQERALLKLKISELESLLKGKGVTAPVAGSTSQSDGPVTHLSNFRTSFGAPSSTTVSSSSNSQVWEGSSPGTRPTRVFPDSEKSDSQSALPEQGTRLSTASLDAALSPNFHATDATASATVSVPIEKLDSKLDGITLKSTALPPEIFARVMTPPSPLSRETSPPPGAYKAENKSCLKLRLSELGPPERNLVRDAGHTPMAVIDQDMDTEQPTPREDPSKKDEPLAPKALRQPAENSDSYFADLPDDPALKGPLSLVNDEEHDSDFLRELNQKLLDEARHILRPSEAAGATREREADAEVSSPGEQDPELKFKSTTNFGTAFGDPELERYLARRSFLT
ncbi:hypothetical protein EYZ11_003091 [Aspergillus tanneri]|uniref:Uncharacterized protein n=1 Tax=Aspergillus tanneri TaxID=1220188 RepID=A0A4S3JPA8_9EURO|nr:uncharacterized protein ATNIH1004_010802 [Aspergillus tanneri]KAA8641863.1 hypothetical protein ATNIH1004_010802 [Aspergillus tanneri]THC97442.1 hypothetical protein EYZ11_003091 [Aspergillus tanneri]